MDVVPTFKTTQRPTAAPAVPRRGGHATHPGCRAPSGDVPESAAGLGSWTVVLQALLYTS